MRFSLQAQEEIVLDVSRARLKLAAAPHPACAGEAAHASTGDRSTVYHLLDRDRGLDYALKIFHASFQRELGAGNRMESLVEFLRPLREIESLSCCDRVCLTPSSAAATLDRYPALAYSHLMPWIDGTTWFDVHQGHENARTLSPWQCLQLATSLAAAVAALEERGMAHRDLNPANVLVDTAPNRMHVELLSLEDVWSGELSDDAWSCRSKPEYLHPVGVCPGRVADRFPAALLLAEILTWHSPAIREVFADQAESLFTIEEIEARASSAKLQNLREALERHGSSLWRLFLRAWESASPDDCPALSEWQAALESVAGEKIEYAWMRRPEKPARFTLSLPQAMAVGR